VWRGGEGAGGAGGGAGMTLQLSFHISIFCFSNKKIIDISSSDFHKNSIIDFREM
jgi:hypothetical protein